ncbi:MAG: hypothetical protein WDN69_09545 [Aliidongia sp.]
MGERIGDAILPVVGMGNFLPVTPDRTLPHPALGQLIRQQFVEFADEARVLGRSGGGLSSIDG